MNLDAQTNVDFASLAKAASRQEEFRLIGLNQYPFVTVAQDLQEKAWGNAISTATFQKDFFFQYAAAKNAGHTSSQIGANAHQKIFWRLEEKTINEVQGDVRTLNVLENGSVELVVLQNYPLDSFSFSRIALELRENSFAKVLIIQKGSSRCHLKLSCALLGQGARIELNVLTLGTKDQVLETSLEFKHRANRTTSETKSCALLKKNAHAIFRGSIDIASDAAFCEANQKSKNWMLSDQARVDTIPQLWIRHDEVKCAHGASVSRLDPEQIFYLTSRGLGRTEAENWITLGLIREMTSGFGDAAVESLPAELGVQNDDL